MAATAGMAATAVTLATSGTTEYVLWYASTGLSLTTKYIYVPRVPKCLAPCRNWDSHPFFRKRVCTPPKTGGHTRLRVWGGHTLLWVREWGSSNSDDWRKSLVYSVYSVMAAMALAHYCSRRRILGIEYERKTIGCLKCMQNQQHAIPIILLHWSLHDKDDIKCMTFFTWQ